MLALVPMILEAIGFGLIIYDVLAGLQEWEEADESEDSFY